MGERNYGQQLRDHDQRRWNQMQEARQRVRREEEIESLGAIAREHDRGHALLPTFDQVGSEIASINDMLGNSDHEKCRRVLDDYDARILFLTQRKIFLEGIEKIVSQHGLSYEGLRTLSYHDVSELEKAYRGKEAAEATIDSIRTGLVKVTSSAEAVHSSSETLPSSE